MFTIDALDECDSTGAPEDAEKLLDFMKELVEDFKNVRIICSSREHVPVQKYIQSDFMYTVFTSYAPSEELRAFVLNETDRLGAQQQDSIFCK